MRDHEVWSTLQLFIVPIAVGAFLFLIAQSASSLAPQPIRISANGEYDPYMDDFVVFYAAGRLASDSQAGAVYDVASIHAQEARVVQKDQSEVIPLPFFNAPPVLIPLSLLAGLSVGMAAVVFTSLSLCAVVFLFWLLRPRTSDASRWMFYCAGILVTAASMPFHEVLLHGQISFVSAVGLALFFAGGVTSSRPKAASIGLVLLALKPQLALVPLAYLVMTRQWAALGRFAVAELLLTAFAMALFGPERLFEWLLLLTEASRWEDENGIWIHAMFGWNAFVRAALGPESESARQVLVGVLSLATVAALVLLVPRAKRQRRTVDVLTMLTAASILLSPHLFSQDLILLAVPLLLQVTRGDAVVRATWAAYALVGWLVTFLHFDVLMGHPDDFSVNLVTLWVASGLLLAGVGVGRGLRPRRPVPDSSRIAWQLRLGTAAMLSALAAVIAITFAGKHVTLASGYNYDGPGVELAFTQSPSDSSVDVAFDTQPTVVIRNASGNTVVSDDMTVVFIGLIGTGSLTCDGGLSRVVVNGVANFSGCRVDAAGVQTLQATSVPALTPASSAPFTVSAMSGTVWYFAEGFTGNGWETYIFLLNATGGAANVSVTYFQAVGPPVVKSIVIPPRSRRTLYANDMAEGPGPGVAFGVTITSDQPITAQQSLIDTSGLLAHGSVGSTALSTSWYFAEGFTGNGWLTFISASNPGETTANVNLTYHLTDGTSVSKAAAVASKSRFTFAGHETDTGVGPGNAFAVSIASDQPIVAQEVLIDTVGLLAHGTIGVTSPGTNWYFAEGFTGDFWLTFISIGNLTATPAQVSATYSILGQAPVTRHLTLSPGSRGTFAGHEAVSGVGPGQAFGVTISSDVPVVAQEVLIDPKASVALAHAVMGSSVLSPQFTFAGGTSEANWITFVSATNPGASETTVTATFYFEDGFSPVTRVVSLPGNSRTTFASFDPSTGVPAGRRYGVKVTATVPIIAQEVVIDVTRFLAYSASGTPGP